MSYQVTENDWHNFKRLSNSKDAAKELSKTLNVSETDASRTLSNLKIVAEKSTFEDFKAYLESGEIPPMKLTASEMENIKGGCIIFPPNFFRILDWKKFAPPV